MAEGGGVAQSGFLTRSAVGVREHNGEVVNLSIVGLGTTVIGPSEAGYINRQNFPPNIHLKPFKRSI